MPPTPGGGRRRGAGWEQAAWAAWTYWHERRRCPVPGILPGPRQGHPGGVDGVPAGASDVAAGGHGVPPWLVHHHRRRRRALAALARPGRFRRSRDDRMIAGVAGGMAARTGFDPTVVRIVVVLAALFSGFGLALYVAAWLLLPADDQESSIAARAVGDWRGIAMALSFLPVVLVALVVARALRVGWLGSLAVPLCVGAGGLVLVWRNVDDQERAVMAAVLRPLAHLGLGSPNAWWKTALRAAFGMLVAGAGTALLLVGANRVVLRPLAGIFLVVAGAVVVFGPWWLHVVRDLVDERQARALAEERADMAARVHDSVLQTLALIQRRAEQPQQVVSLARAQERELRSWLFEGRAPGSGVDGDGTVGAAVRRIQQEVEALHEVPVEAVTVGDCPVDDDLRALLAAGREATVNAAKWSGAPAVSLFAEVEPEAVSLFVRDRGRGFDPAAVAEDRRGVAESVVGRMARHGGTAEVRSTPGAGTEVELRMPRRTRREHKAAE